MFVKNQYNILSFGKVKIKLVVLSVLRLNRNMNNEVVRKCANISSISERIKQLAKSWYKKAIINNSDIKEYITTLKHL